MTGSWWRVSGLSALACSALVLSACLGPTDVDPTGTAPIGNLELAVGDGASIRLVGWALDPDTSAPIDVVVSVQSIGSTHRADLPRPDVGRAHPGKGDRHGFDIRTRPLPPGLNQVCIWAPNVLRGTQDRILGCLDVRTGSDDVTGRFDAVVRLNQTTIRATGWAYDPEATGSVDVTVSHNGVARPRQRATVSRPDVARHVRKAGNYGYVVDLPAAPGDHRVCVTAHNVGRGRDADLGCRSIRINSTPTVGPGAGISSLSIVGPVAGHPLNRIERDAGVTTQLRDGSVLWLFGDSSEPVVGGSGFRYFVNNTAAWARAASPTVTRDAVAAGDRPFTFVTPTTQFSQPCPAGWKPLMWPMSATSVPDGPRDRVIAFFGNVCMTGNTAVNRGTSVVEWTYDPATPPDGTRIEGKVLAQNLFPAGTDYGTAAMIVEDGGQTYLYAYRCGRPGDNRTGIVWPDDPAYSGCRVGRVQPERVHERNAWSFWTGGSNWSSAESSAALMELPGRSNGDKQMPVTAFSVVDDPQFGHLMVYSPWPGYTEEIFVRTAPGPTGPWSAPRLIRLPGCNEWANGSRQLCYAGTAQPWRSTPGLLGLGYFDQYMQEPGRGAYFAASAPFAG